MTSVVMITPIDTLDQANQFTEQLNWGSGVFSVPLSKDGELPITHYGCRADTDTTFEPLEGIITDLSEILHGYDHWIDVLSKNGLNPVLINI